MSEFLGSRISLISKSDIRYVGVLHEINSDESTVSLENVRSFGTEGRKGRPEEEVGPSDQVYEYIVFRGSDVKDLRIEEHPGIKENKPPAMPDDPAIVGATRTRPGPQGPNQNGPPPPGSQGPPGHFGQQPPFPPNNYYGPPGAWGRGGPGGPMPGPGGFGNMHYPPPPGWFPPGQGFPPGPGGPGPPWANQSFPPGPAPPGGQEAQNQRGPPGAGPQDGKPAPIGPGSDRSKTGTPSQHLPSAESKARPPPTSATAEAPAPTPPVESKPSTDEVKAVAAHLVEESSKAPEAAKPPPASKSHRVNPVIPLSGPSNRFQPPVSRDQASATSVQATVATAPGSVQDATSAARAAVAVAMAQLGNNTSGNAMDNLTNKVNEMRVNAVRGGPVNRGRGRGSRPQGKVEVPDSDFDFAQSNAKFNKEDVVKEAIAGPPLTETANGSTPPAVAEASTSSDVPVAYNKSRSFFDNISSEARERSENQGQRAGGREWRDEEQRRNMETFGQGSVDGGHRNHRGRGRGRGRGGRGRGMGRGGRGGNRPQFQTAEQ